MIFYIWNVLHHLPVHYSHDPPLIYQYADLSSHHYHHYHPHRHYCVNVIYFHLIIINQ